MTEVEGPFDFEGEDFEGDEWDEWFANGSPSERLDCAGPYDAARTAGSTLWSQYLLQLPHGWRVAEAVERPLGIDWHDTRIRWMRVLEIAEADPDVSYLNRVAILVWETYTTAPWPELCRRGAAYSLLYVAVESHRFAPRQQVEGETAEEAAVRARAVNFFLDPPEDFFELLTMRGGRDALAELLVVAFHRPA